MLVVGDFKRHEDREKCTCLRCRRVDIGLLRRSIVGDFLWATTLLRRYPSLLGVVVGLTVVTGFLWPVLEEGPQTWPIGTALVGYIALHATVLRAYAVAVTTDALTGTERKRSARQLFLTSQRWLPTIAITLLVTVMIGGVAVGLASLLVWSFLQGVYAFDAVIGTTTATGSVFDGTSATLLFGSVAALSVFKLWLAPEICVAGGYGPLTGLRLSWSITGLYRWRVLRVVGGFALSIFIPELGGRVVTAIGGEWLLGGTVTGLAQSLFFGLTFVIWYAVGTQIYLRYALQE